MYRRFGLIYSIFSVIVLIVLAVFVLMRLNTARSANLADVDATFRVLVRDVRDAAERDASVPDLLRRHTATMPDVRALVYFDPDRGLRYLWTADTSLLAFSTANLEGFRGFPRYRLSDVRDVRLRDEITPAAGDRYYLDAVYTVLTFREVYPAMRDSLIALLVFAFVTILVILLFGRFAPSAADGPADGAADGAAEGSARPRRAARAREKSTASPRRRRDRANRDEDAAVSYEEVSPEELANDPAEPGTLVNPVTGLSHRAHLDRRLGLELERSAYNDQDLSCMLIRFADVSGADAYSSRAKQILEAFQFEDLCFEYDETSYCVIVPNTELTQAIRQAESFRKRHPKCTIGLSARSGRLVEAQRVLTEADRSLSRAAAERGRIVGFRPDPKKYRQFITQHFGNEGQQ
jgi:GGDEF domain-containing protein